MSSDGYFDDDDGFDAAALAQLNAIEAAHLSPKRATSGGQYPATSSIPVSSSKPVPQEASYDDISFDFNDDALASLDTFIADSYEGKAKPVTCPSKVSRTSSSNKLQTTLFGEVLQPAASSSSSKPKLPLERTKSTPRNLFGQQARKTKQWDHTQFAKTGIRKAKSTKGKGRIGEGDDEEEEVEFEQFPAPFISIGPPPKMKISADLLEAKHWIYPLNRPKRDYQFNIVKKSLFDNTLVALPTGLGKTFIAGVVMLNYYRWFPEGKVVFVAPAKPLVAQQIIACHETCGIPGSDSIELNGDVTTAVRARYWKEKRVFFMTPQTFMNDLQSERCDAGSIVLYVVDEAHRATGDYSYNQVLRYLMAKNPHFRVLALTATPGNNAEAIQALVDSLHISHIEIRNEESLDLKAYIHKKVYRPHVIGPDETLLKLRDLLVKVMDAYMKPLMAAGLLHHGDNAIKIHPYRTQALMATAKDKSLYSPLSMVSKLARAMLYLLAGSYRTCYTYCQELMNDVPSMDAEGSKKNSSKKLKDDPNFRVFMAEYERQYAQGFATHPKIEKLKTILIQHFGSRMPDEGEDDTRVMVFSSFRGVVDEIVEELNTHSPLIRPSRFIGQGTDKQGKKGQGQKEQLEVINKFKAGTYNVLVATSIGEEGLDIGEIDMTICYDADKAPTRMIQRFGRTGRKREGTIHALLAEGREEGNIDKAENSYKEVQNVVNKGELYELYGDVERLLPDHIEPQCVEKVVEIQKYVREEGRQKAPAKDGPQGKKRKRNDDVLRNIPDGASTSFVSVRDLVVKGAKKTKKAVLPKNFETLGEDDETDEEIESGRVVAPARRTQSAAATLKAPKSKLKKSATIATNKAPKKRKKTKEYSASQLSKLAVDDSDDMDIEAGIVIPSLRYRLEASRSSMPSTPELSPKPSLKRLKRKKHIDKSFIESSDSELRQSLSPKPQIKDDSPNFDPLDFNDNGSPKGTQNMSWLVDNDDDENQFSFNIVDSSPLAPRQPCSTALERVQLGDESLEMSNPVRYDDEVIPTSDPFEPPVEDPLEFLEPVPPRKENNKVASQSIPFSPFRPASAFLSPSRKTNAPESSRSHHASSSKITTSPSMLDCSSSPIHRSRSQGKASMLPPASPRRLLASPRDLTSVEMPEPSFPVRPLKHQAKRRRVIYDEPESPNAALDADFEIRPPSQRRLHRIESAPLRKSKKQRREKPSLLARNVNQLFDGEAEHSGDEVSEGYSDEDEESESDRQFIKNSPATQASQSYDQSLIYRQSLLTQAPGPFGSRPPVRTRPFGRIDGVRPGRQFLPSSSPPPPDDDLDHYNLGSFVVDDDDEISYDV